MLKRLLVIFILTVSASTYSPPSYAMSRGLQKVLITSFYGIVIGTGLGLIAWPIRSSASSVLIGAGLGLFVGLGAGTYFALGTDTQGDPLHVRYPVVNPQRGFAFQMQVPVYTF